MALKIIWNKRAVIHFDHTISYLAENWGQSVATRFVNQVYSSVEMLSELPELGAIQEPDKEIRAILITKHNRLFYRVKGTRLFILSFLDNRTRKSNRKVL